MKKIAFFMLFLLLTGLAGASSYFKVIDVSPIHMAPNSEANFTVTIKGLGSQGEYVQLIFKNLTKGLSIIYSGGTKYVFPTGTRTYNCTIRAGDIPPGNYSFEVGVYAQEAKPNWREVYAMIEPANATQPSPQVYSLLKNLSNAIKGTETTEKSPQAKKTPGPGFAVAIIAFLLGARRIRS